MKTTLLSFLLLLITLHSSADDKISGADKRRHDREATTGYAEMLESGEMFRSFCIEETAGHVHDVLSLELLFNPKTDATIFINRRIYDDANQFYNAQLGSRGDFIHAQLRYYRRTDTYALVVDQPCDALAIRTMYHTVIRNSFLHNNLGVLIHTPALRELDRQGAITVPRLYPGKLQQQQDYRALKPGTAYGILRRVNSVEDMYDGINPGDILVLDNPSLDHLPACAAVICTEPVNEFSGTGRACEARHIPYAFEEQAWNDALIEELEFKPVKLIIGHDSLRITEASMRELKHWQQQQLQARGHVTKANVVTTQIQEISGALASDVESIGINAAMLASTIELLATNVPEAPGLYAVPFSYYHDHISDPCIQFEIDKLYSDAMYTTVRDSLEIQLLRIREAIQATPVNPGLISALHEIVAGNHYSLNASTNEPGTPGWDPMAWYPAIESTPDALGQDILQLWLAPWQRHAFETRSAAGLDTREVKVGVVVRQILPGDTEVTVITTRNENMVKWKMNIREGRLSEQLSGKLAGDQLQIEYSSYDQEHNILSMPVLETLCQALQTINAEGKSVWRLAGGETWVLVHTEGMMPASGEGDTVNR